LFNHIDFKKVGEIQLCFYFLAEMVNFSRRSCDDQANGSSSIPDGPCGHFLDVSGPRTSSLPHIAQWQAHTQTFTPDKVVANSIAMFHGPDQPKE